MISSTKQRQERTEEFVRWYLERRTTHNLGEMAAERGMKPESLAAKVSKLRANFAEAGYILPPPDVDYDAIGRKFNLPIKLTL